MSSTEQIKTLLHGRRLPMSPEKATQAAIEKVFLDHGVPHDREHRIEDVNGVADFRIGRIIIEVKVRKEIGPMAIYRQIKQYSLSNEVDEIIIASARSLALPEELNGKKITVINLSKAWL